MHLYTLIIGIWLLPRGDTLTCLECNPDITGTCTETQIECPSQGYQCGATREVYYAAGLTLKVVEEKACVLPGMCGQDSVNFGAFQIVRDTKCCKFNNCNSELPEPSNNIPNTPNGKQCFSGSDLTCEGKILTCERNEDFCVTITVETGRQTTLKGCASKLMCSSLNYTASYYGAHFSCCEGSVITTSLQLVIVAMVSLALFS
uniref:UPAR/Ly6 domain-containing protein n=1 Tax=Oryzias melastigma TaxID=30732 RepID=A0A3B3CFL9_ORYME